MKQWSNGVNRSSTTKRRLFRGSRAPPDPEEGTQKATLSPGQEAREVPSDREEETWEAPSDDEKETQETPLNPE